MGGRAIEAQKSAIRTVLRRRDVRRGSVDEELMIRRATMLVNECRGPRDQITVGQMDRYWAASIVGSPVWAELFATAEEMRADSAA
jgi:hypothetical protein